MSFDIRIERNTYELENDAGTVIVYREIVFDPFQQGDYMDDLS